VIELPFSRPWALLLLALPGLLVWWTWRRTSGRLVLPLDGSPRGGGGGWRVVLDAAGSLPALLLAAAVLLLAGPQRWSEPRTQRVLTNIEFCLDVSGSMTAEFGGDGSAGPFGGGTPGNTRYDAAMEAINQFITYREGDAFGLTIFGNEVMHWVPLTSDVSAFRCAPPFLRPELLPGWFGGTEVGKALRACRKVLAEREEGDRLIVLVSDGYSADLFGEQGEAVARELAAEGITVYWVHVAEGEPPAETALICDRTGGQVFAAGDPEMLRAVFQRIDQMQKARLETVQGEAVDWFEPVCLAGLVLLGLHSLCAFGLRTTPW
jgi:Ca-activated chloride channel family protein